MDTHTNTHLTYGGWLCDKEEVKQQMASRGLVQLDQLK